MYGGFSILAGITAWLSLKSEKEIAKIEKRLHNLEILNNRPSFTIKKEEQDSIIPFQFKKTANQTNRKWIYKKINTNKKPNIYNIIIAVIIITLFIGIIGFIMVFVLIDKEAILNYIIYTTAILLIIGLFTSVVIMPIFIRFYYKLPFQFRRQFETIDDKLIAKYKIKNPNYIPMKK